MYTLTNIDGHFFPGPQDIYVLDIQRTSAGLAAISSDQALSLLDPARLRAGPAKSLRTNHGNLTSLRVFDAGNAVVCTAGENGSVGVWDLRIGAAAAEVAHFAASQSPILSLACNSGTQNIAVGTELQNHTASLFLWDVRSTPAPKAAYNEVHSDDITSLTFHSSKPELLLSGSTDGLVNVYDTRVADEDEVVIQTFNHNASIHHAAFLGSATEVLAISHDERFALYDMAEEALNGDATQDFGDLRAGLNCQYVADVQPKADGSGAVIGAGAQDREIFELVHMAKGAEWALDRDNSVGLPGAHGGEIVRSFCFFDEEQVVFTAGEDGFIKAWGPGG